MTEHPPRRHKSAHHIVDLPTVALAAVVGGTGGTTDIAMREVVGHVLSYDRPALPGDTGPVAPPRSRTPAQAAAEMGADTDAVLSELSHVARPPNVADPSDRANR